MKRTQPIDVHTDNDDHTASAPSSSSMVTANVKLESPKYKKLKLTPSQNSETDDNTSNTTHNCSDCSNASTTTITKKRTENVIKWDDYFMAIAFLSSMRSKDPSTQVGACIVNTENRIVGIGYNGFPKGCSDDILPWDRVAENELDTKYPYVCHAEVNAILNKNSTDVKGCTIYVALFPCNECAKLIIQSGITEVVYLSDKYHTSISMQASRRMMVMAGIKLRVFTPDNSSIYIDFKSIDI